MHINIHSLKCTIKPSVEHYRLPQGKRRLEDGLVEFVVRRVDGEFALVGERVEGTGQGCADSDVAGWTFLGEFTEVLPRKRFLAVVNYQGRNG